MPEVRRTEQCVERWIVRIGLDRLLQLFLDFGNSVVVVPVVRLPEPFNRCTADSVILLALISCRLSALRDGCVSHANHAENSRSH